ncbi:pectinesterase 3-like [Panicum miliaceum]|uniref:Pectinesterase 3-like n=1 Tax=Panicum miliaceum TaxID=4540 RepID=A0A3L6T4U4_PANMI|nr:pectinesterase 3-like [Panicum miliaceum]
MRAMPPPLLACLLTLLVATAVAPTAVCVSKKAGAPAKPKSAPAPPKPITPIPGADIVRSLCLKTDYPDLCTSSLSRQPQPHLPGGKRLDGAGVLRLAMAAVRGRAAEAREAAAALASDPRTQPQALGPLRDCVASFDDLADSLDGAEEALAAGDRGTTGTMLDTVRTDVDTCDQGFEERRELNPVMAERDAELAKLASNCLAIATAAGLR